MDRAEQTAQAAHNQVEKPRAHWGRTILILALLTLVLGGVPFLKGELLIARHEGDTLHLIDIVLRMTQFGQVPHLDFMTPLGILGIAPIAWFVEAGNHLGKAFFMAQALVALVLFAPAVYAAGTRLAWPWAILCAGYVMMLSLAIVHGEANPAISVSMHYNRWAWAVSYVVILLTLPPLARETEAGKPARWWIDALLIGVGMAALGLLKATYAIALAPAVIVILLVRGQVRGLVLSVLAGLMVMGGAALAWGISFWPAYVADLLAVATSDTRAAPGASFEDIVSGPSFVVGNLALLAGVVLLRRAERMTEGLLLLLLTPAFLYITYQNFGNDPQWLILIAMILLSGRSAVPATNIDAVAPRMALTVTAAVILALGSASVINLGASPIRHYFLTSESPAPLVSGADIASDVMSSKGRLYSVTESRNIDASDSPYAGVSYVDPEAEPAMVNGEVLSDCDMSSGFSAYFEVVSRDLEGAGYGGSALLAADLFGAFWLYGDFKPVDGAAPWYYAGASGVQHADYVLVPLCATGRSQRKAILKGIADAGWGLEEVRRTALYILFRPVAPQ